MLVKLKNIPKGRLLLIGGFILVNLVIQIIGYIDYQGVSDFFWDISNAIMILTPLLFGLIAGLLCLVPMFAFELVWFIKLLKPGPLLHVGAYLLMAILLALVYKKVSALSPVKRSVITGLVFEAAILASEYVYYLSRNLVLVSHPAVTWPVVSTTFISWANPVVLCIGLIIIFAYFRKPRTTL